MRLSNQQQFFIKSSFVLKQASKWLVVKLKISLVLQNPL